MSTHRDPETILGSWIEDGPTELPEATRRAIDVAVRSLPQRRGFLGLPLRAPALSGPLRLGAAAAIVIALAGALALANSRDNVGGVPGPTASPSTTPQPSPSGRLLSEAAVGPAGLPPGQYVIDRPFPLRIGFMLPAGWDVWTVDEDYAGLLAWTADEHGSGWPLVFWIVDQVGDPCGTGQLTEVGPGVEDLVGALQNLTEYEVTQPVPVAIDGYTGVQLAITAPEGLGGCGARPVWSTRTDPAALSISAGERLQIRILDVDGTRLVISAADYPHTSPFEERFVSPDPAAHVEDLAEVQAIIESITIEP